MNQYTFKVHIQPVKDYDGVKYRDTVRNHLVKTLELCATVETFDIEEIK